MKTELFFVHLYNDYSGSPRVFSDAIDIAGDCSKVNSRLLFTSNHEGFLSNKNIDENYFFYKRTSSKPLQAIYFLLSQVHLFFLLSRRLICTRLKCKGSNAVVVINTMLPFGAAIASKLFASKTIYYVHESHIKPNVIKKFLRFIIELTSDYVIFVSNYLLNAEGFNNPTMKVIYNGLRRDFPSYPVVDSCKKFNARNVVFSGSLKEYKGIDNVIKIASLMPQFNFILALNCTSHEVNEYVESKDVTKNVTFNSRPKNLSEIYCNAFAILNLSIPELWTETFGLSILEGMNYGCVPVVPPVGGPIEIVDSDCALVCDPRNITEIVDFLTELSKDFTLWKAFSDAAQNRSQLFSQDSYRDNFMLFLKDHC